MTGRLVLVGTPIGNLGDLSPRAVDALSTADTIACEDTRRTRALLSHLGLPAGRRLLAVHDHNEAVRVVDVLARLDNGERVVVVTDAGMPGISDPGERLVRAASGAGHVVEVVPGPSALVAALVASGLPADRFLFLGFPPREDGARRELVGGLRGERATMIFYEAPD
ncbi:MAG TPA: ribosomal RNA small subunit methyltransferase I, partial [Acidimicrobiales bacterium]|nr:ribosomal RNA small subunit methyltransferase I [Acidimicrobiales bacterium]